MEVRRDFDCTKAWSCSGNHWNTAFFARIGWKGSIIAVSSLEKLPTWLTDPSHERRSERFLGQGNFLMDFNRSGLVWMPVFDRQNPPRSRAASIQTFIFTEVRARTCQRETFQILNIISWRITNELLSTDEGQSPKCLDYSNWILALF